MDSEQLPLANEKRFLVDVGLRDLPLPIRAISRQDAQGQATVADISVSARIMQEFEAKWIDRLIQTLHRHREAIGAHALKDTLADLVNVLGATTVNMTIDYPFFVEKRTPVSRESGLVRCLCRYSAKSASVASASRVIFRIEVPCVTTYPASSTETPGGLFGQLSELIVEVESEQEVFPEDLVELVDRHALCPVYSFLTEEDQLALIHRIHAEKLTSVMVVDRVKTELARRRDISWYAVQSANFGMLHPYSTVIATHKSRWVPHSGYDEDI
jgi:GTP cyclohydrolase I